MTPHRPDRRRLPLVLAAGALALAIPLGMPGCEKKQKQVQAPPPPPPPRRLDPLEDLDMDPRVQFPEAREPSTRELAEAIAEFSSALVRGDDATLSAMMDADGRTVLSALKSSGHWKAETSRIEAVRVCTLEEADDAVRLGLGIQDPEGAYVLAWTGTPDGDSYTFSPLPMEYVQRDSVAMLDELPLIPPALPGPAERNAPPEADEDSDDD